MKPLADVSYYDEGMGKNEVASIAARLLVMLHRFKVVGDNSISDSNFMRFVKLFGSLEV